jgi:Tfp pilus assembly protein PilF
MFFVASMVSYAQSRLVFVENGVSRKNRKWVSLSWYASAVICSVLAMETKEIAFTLPCMLLIFEFGFFPGRSISERLKYLAPVVLTLLIIPYNIIESSGVDGLSRAADLSRHDYLLTQFRVITTYLRLLILPVHQVFDYGYPIFRTFSDKFVFLSFILLVILFAVSAVLLVKGGGGRLRALWRIVGFGGIWFFVTLSVESSIVPITDVIFEHRLYLPSVGFFLSAVMICINYSKRVRSTSFKRAAIVVCAAIVVVTLSAATYARNRVWSSERLIWEDVLAKRPGNARGHAMIGAILAESGNVDEAISQFKTAIRLKPDYADAYICLGSAYTEKGLPEEGYQQFLKAMDLGTMDFESRSHLMNVIGNYNLRKGAIELAIYYYQMAISLTPNVPDIHYNLSQAYKTKKMMPEAVAEFSKAVELDPKRFGTVQEFLAK